MAEFRSDSMYRKTAVVNNKYLDVWVPDVTDITLFNTKTITLESKYENRPDKLAYDLYGNAKLWWVFAQFNQDTLQDPIIDFVSGLEITVPTKFT
jgi:hypothetical protein